MRSRWDRKHPLFRQRKIHSQSTDSGEDAIERPQRKRLRLESYDYSQPGSYFITICTRERNQEVLCSIEPAVGAIINRPPRISLTPLGRIVDATIRAIPDHYPGISVDQYIIMPDHVHLILALRHIGPDGRQIAAPTPLSNVIQQMKRITSKQAGISLWQKGFYDHVIRNDEDLANVRQYIRNNPLKWIQDKD